MTTTKTPYAFRAQAELELRGRRSSRGVVRSIAEIYRYDPVGYVRDKLGWEPWAGVDGKIGQVEILEAYIRAIRQQEERRAWENSELAQDELVFWQPGQPIQRHIRIASGHGNGKTKVLAAIQNHFFDCFDPSVSYSFAPTATQINDLLWKEIRSDRAGTDLIGIPLEGKPEMRTGPRHFAKGRATSDSHGRGRERVQGQHDEYMLFLVDEAEGVPAFVFDGIEGMETGGIVIIVYAANPRTRISRFHKLRGRGDVASFTMSCLDHPNVLAGRDVVPNAVRREWVEGRIDKMCHVVRTHDPDEMTFEVPFPVLTREGLLEPGTIFRPDPDFLWQVLGKAPANLADDTLVPLGRFEAAVERKARSDRPTEARMGLDVARFGKDVGTLYIRSDGEVWRAERFAKKDTNVYARVVKEQALELAKQGVEDLRIRVDAGGGFGGGVIDKLKIDEDLIEAFTVFEVLEVNFGGTPHDGDAYVDCVTEMYAESAETLRGVAVLDPDDSLEADLCERRYKWVNRKGKDVKRLVPKEEFRTEHKRSPDDGDGFVLACAPDFIFGGDELEEIVEMGLNW